MSVDVARTLAGLDALLARMDLGVKQSIADAAHLIQAAAMEKAPVGTPGNSTNAPGDLARSIEVEGPTGGDGIYAAELGPTVIHGRQRELGGEIYGFEPLLHFFRFGQEIYTSRVYQKPEPYMLPALEENWVDIIPLVNARIAEVLETS